MGTNRSPHDRRRRLKKDEKHLLDRLARRLRASTLERARRPTLEIRRASVRDGAAPSQQRANGRGPFLFSVGNVTRFYGRRSSSSPKR